MSRVWIQSLQAPMDRAVAAYEVKALAADRVREVRVLPSSDL